MVEEWNGLYVKIIKIIVDNPMILWYSIKWTVVNPRSDRRQQVPEIPA